MRKKRERLVLVLSRAWRVCPSALWRAWVLALVFILGVMVPVHAGNNAGAAFDVWPDTGQTKCYDADGNEITCPSEGEDFYGQDGNYQGPIRRYTKLDYQNGQLVELDDSASSWTMVRDNVTGLIWEVKTDKDGTENFDNPHDADNIYFWCDTNSSTNGGVAGACSGNQDVEDFVTVLNNIRFGGFSDWRVPTIKELMTLINYSRTAPAVDAGFFPNIRSDYWSSTTTPAIDEAWCVNFANGYNFAARKDSYGYVRAVRGTPIQQSHFFDNHDGTITDMVTGLMWQKCSMGQTYNSSEGSCEGTVSEFYWRYALGACQGMTLAGHNDWRLPNRNELLSIVDYSKSWPAIDTNFFPETGISDPEESRYHYWSSTTFAGNTGVALAVEFAWGGTDANLKWLYTKYVRCVRGGFSGSFDDLTISLQGSGTGTVSGTATTTPSTPDRSCQTGPCVWPYPQGTTVTLTATAGAGSTFGGWGGVCSSCGSSATCQVTMDADKSCNATFTSTTPNQHTITTTATPSSGGSVSCSPNPVDHGSTSTCTISPASGYHTASVNGTCGGTLSGNTYTTNQVTADCTVVANFEVFQVDDGDGVNGSQEDNVPDADGSGNGDGNGDGVQDSQQNHVTSVNSAVGEGYLTLDNTGGCEQNDVQAVPPPGDAPSGIVFPYGMLDFHVNACSNPVTMRVFVPKDTRITSYWKKNMDTGQWDNIATNIEHGPSYAPEKTVITFELTDGGPYDEDGAQNGVILDQGGPGYPAPASNAKPVPLLDDMARAMLIFILLAAGLRVLVRRESR